MAQLTNRGGGDHHSKQAKVDIARREEQIVALRLCHHSFAAIGRSVGISKQAAQRAFQKAASCAGRGCAWCAESSAVESKSYDPLFAPQVIEPGFLKGAF